MKLTRKCATACNIAVEQGINYALLTQDQIYAELQKRGYFWDPKSSRWDHYSAEAASAPTDLIRMRVWAAAGEVEKIADLVVVQMNDFGRLKLVEQSEPYPCRPPKQLESRVYLTFQRREK